MNAPVIIETVRTHSVVFTGPPGPPGSSGVYDTPAVVEMTRVPSFFTAIYVRGYYFAGDGAGAWYVETDVAPSAAGGTIQSLDGRLWTLSIVGYVDTRLFGSDLPTTEDAHDNLQAAIDYARDMKLPVYLLGKRNQAAGKSRYRSNAALYCYDGTNILGFSKSTTEIQFPNNTNGFEMFDAASAGLTRDLTLAGFRIMGNAATSTDPTETIGLHGKIIRDCYFDIEVEQFVHTVKLDAADTGLISVRGIIRVVQSNFPNPVNNYPSNGIWLTGGTKQPQLVDLVMKIYSSISAISTDSTVPANKQITLALGAKGPLWRYGGVQVYKYDSAAGEYTRDTDYILQDMDSVGAPVAIPPDTENIFTDDDERVSNLRIDLGSSWAEGDSVRVTFADSWGLCALRIDKGSGNAFRGDVGGYRLGCYVNGPNNKVDLNYVQILNDGIYQAGPLADGSELVTPRQISRRTIGGPMVVQDADCKGLQLMPTTFTKVLQYNDQTITSASTVDANNFVPLAGPSGGFIEILGLRPSWRQVHLELDIDNTLVSGTVEIEVAIEKSSDKRQTWDVVIKRRFGISDLVMKGSVIIDWLDDEVLDQVGGIVWRRSYRGAVRSINTNHNIIINAASTYASYIQVDEINPQQGIVDEVDGDVD